MDSFGVLVDKTCVFESAIKICFCVRFFDFLEIRIPSPWIPRWVLHRFLHAHPGNPPVIPTTNQFLSDEEAKQHAEKIPRKGTTK